MNSLLLRFVFVPVLLASAALGLAAQERIAIAAAANLSSVVPELEKVFHSEYPGDTLVFTLGSSGSLVAQMLQGASYDVFLSADMHFAQRLVSEKRAATPVRPYAVGHLVLFTARGIDLSSGLACVRRSDVHSIANSNPDLAPYGRAALQALTRSGLLDAVRSKFVVAQNISQAVQFTLTGTDVGFVARSAMAAPALAAYREGRDWFVVDPALYDPIEQGYVVLKGSETKRGVRDFDSFLQSASFRKLLLPFGYSAPGAP